MTTLDWVVFIGVLTAVMWYGMWRGRAATTAGRYMRSGQQLPWPMVLLGIMATQASAITFLSAPGQAYVDGMRFVQYYFGLPLAMIVIGIIFVPIYRRFDVYTAYEYLEKRFDRRTRIVTAMLFLVSRGLSTGISIYAPSIIVSSILGWDIYLTNVLVGGALIVYTMRGGSDAVVHTQTVMFGIIILSMVAAGVVAVMSLPANVGLAGAITLAGLAGKLNVITTDVNFTDKYTLFSGIVGGFFLALSYFGTDQSQVGRFIGGRDEAASKKALYINGVVKIPMQAGILFVGVILAALYSVSPAPIFFNPAVRQHVATSMPQQAAAIEEQWQQTQQQLQLSSEQLLRTDGAGSANAEREYVQLRHQTDSLRLAYSAMVQQSGAAERSDANYVFLHFVRNSIPAGLVGLIFAVVIMASWGSISAALHALASSSVVDVHNFVGGAEVAAGATSVSRMRWHTLAWGVFGIAIAMTATRMGSLIEAVNVLGSLFYGPMLGIFLVAFFVRRAGAHAVITGAAIAEALVLGMWWWDVVSFLWLNVVGAVAVVVVAMVGALTRVASTRH
jgi:SSS family solute:Na+ symporter